MKRSLTLAIVLLGLLAPSLAKAATDHSEGIPLPGGVAEKVTAVQPSKESRYQNIANRIKLGPKIKYQITESVRLTLKPRKSKVQLAMELKF